MAESFKNILRQNIREKSVDMLKQFCYANSGIGNG